MILALLAVTLSLQGLGSLVHHRISHAAIEAAAEPLAHGCAHHQHHDAPADEPDQPAPGRDCRTCVMLALGFGLTLPAAPTPVEVILPTLSGVPPDEAQTFASCRLVRSHPATGPPRLA
jgi:hypothetical protein